MPATETCSPSTMPIAQWSAWYIARIAAATGWATSARLSFGPSALSTLRTAWVRCVCPCSEVTVNARSMTSASTGATARRSWGASRLNRRSLPQPTTSIPTGPLLPSSRTESALSIRNRVAASESQVGAAA